MQLVNMMVAGQNLFMRVVELLAFKDGSFYLVASVTIK
jgi:hypothetical protein